MKPGSLQRSTNLCFPLQGKSRSQTGIGDGMKASIHIMLVLFSLPFLTSCSDELQQLGPDSSDAFVKLHGSSYDQRAAALLPRVNGYLLAGTSQVEGLEAYGQEVYLVETDEGGNEVATPNIDFSSTGADKIQVRAMIEATDGGYYLCGLVLNPNDSLDAWVVKLSDSYEILWQETYGSSATDEIAVNMVENNGFLYFVGATSNVDPLKAEGPTPAIDSRDVYLGKISTNDGQLEWESVYGYTGLDIGVDIVAIEDGRLAILGTTEYPESGSTDKDILLILINEEGHPYHTQTFGEPDQDDFATDMTTVNEQLVITGFSDGEGILFLILDQQLQVIESQQITAIPAAIANHILPLDNGNFLITGSGSNADDTDMLTIELDASGMLIGGPSFFGGQGSDVGVAAITAPDGYIRLGTLQFGSNSMMGLVKTRLDGTL